MSFPGARIILVVEDDEATRELYRQALVVAGYQVVAVSDGLEALRIVETKRPAAVVLDLLLPRLGGLDVYKELQAHRPTRDIPVIVVTGSESRESTGSEFRFFLRKPVHVDTLVRVVEDAIRTARQVEDAV
jgi:CheY-like chemotaxis protein